MIPLSQSLLLSRHPAAKAFLLLMALRRLARAMSEGRASKQVLTGGAH
jgi:hypothetical protein